MFAFSLTSFPGPEPKKIEVLPELSDGHGDAASVTLPGLQQSQ